MSDVISDPRPLPRVAVLNSLMNKSVYEGSKALTKKSQSAFMKYPLKTKLKALKETFPSGACWRKPYLVWIKPCRDCARYSARDPLHNFYA